MKIEEKDFERIRPYHDFEINAAIRRINEAPVFSEVSKFVFPEKSFEEVKILLHGIYSADEFQFKFMHKAVRQVVSKTSDGLTYDGFDVLDHNTPYLFIANHRDIVLDSAILQILLVEHNIPTSEITFGSNLMTSQFIIDLGKVNKMFTVFRGGSKLELLKNSKLLSSYIRYTINNKRNSAWIAQRNGRTKDGNDRTEEALLKMINLSGNKNFVEDFSTLNIVPLTISYEYEPCGIFKVKELYESLNSVYIKSKDEDLKSIVAGILEPKGRIHLSAGETMNKDLMSFDNDEIYNDNISKLTKLIDDKIYQNYKLWSTNYIAYDILFDSSENKHLYSTMERDKFTNFMNTQINALNGDKEILKEMYLKMYANPVINKNRHS